MDGPVCAACLEDFPFRRSLLLQRHIPFVDRALAAFRYDFPITDMVKAAKFHADLGALAVLAVGFTDEFVAALGDVDVLVPVPLLPWRFLRRGFNQATELARVLGQRSGYAVRHDILARERVWGLAQSRLDAASRRKNMQGAFRVKADVAGLRVAIVDDVITTGATCAALAGVLRHAGARQVTAVAIAATALRHDAEAASSGSPTKE
jgi:ComF family protein